MKNSRVVLIPEIFADLQVATVRIYGGKARKGMPGAYDVPEHQAEQLEVEVSHRRALAIATYLANRRVIEAPIARSQTLISDALEVII